MPWCPKCKSEYREGFKVCADCGCELVEEMPENEKSGLTFGTKEEMSRLADFLAYGGIGGVKIQYDEKEDSYDLSVDSQDLERAGALTRVFLMKEREQKEACSQEGRGSISPGNQDNAMDTASNADIQDNAVSAGSGNGSDDAANTDGESSCPDDALEADQVHVARQLQEAAIARKTMGSSSLYQDSSKRADDNRSSAWVLTITGFLGIVVVILALTDIIPFHVGNPYLVYGVMGVIFLLFVIAGFVSMKNAKVFARKAESENSLRSTMLAWCKENLKAEEIDGELSCESEPEELKYFNRIAYMKERLNRQFMNLDQDFLDQFIDDQVYEMIFGETA